MRSTFLRPPRVSYFFTPELLTDFPVCVRHLTQCLAPWEVGWKGPWGVKGAVHQCCLILPSLSPTRCHIGAASRSTVIRMCHLDGTSDSYFDLASGYVWESLPPPGALSKVKPSKCLQMSQQVWRSDGFVSVRARWLHTPHPLLLVAQALGHLDIWVMVGSPHLPGCHPCILLHQTCHHVSLGVWLSKSNVRWFSILLVSLPKVPTKASQSGRSCNPWLTLGADGTFPPDTPPC